MKINRRSSGGVSVEFPTFPGGAFLRDDNTWQAVPGGGDMLKSQYDINDDGVVDAATRSNVRMTREEITITEGKVNHVLSNTPTTLIKVFVQGGPEAEYGTDYIIDGATIDWEGLGLDGYLETGWVLVVEYSY